MARTVEVFRKNGLEVERLRTEQHEAEKGNAEQRRADKYKLADKFEAQSARSSKPYFLPRLS
jgi:hypothetical protein